MGRRGVIMILGASALLLSPCAHAQDTTNSPNVEVEAGVGEDVQRAVQGINAFSLDLYKHRSKPGENLFLSPASVSVAVGLAYRGAKGLTAEELNRTLHFGASPTDYLRADGELLATMNFAGPGRALNAANSIWLQSGLPLKPDFEADIARYAKAAIHYADFAGATEPSRVAINRWVAQTTHDKIKELLQRDDISSETGSVLVNAIYWKGDWARPFDETATRPEPFTLASGRIVTTRLMHREDDFAVIARDGVKAISLHYKGGEVSMVVLLPNSPKALDKFEQKLTSPKLARWILDLKGARYRRTVLSLPKLNLDWRDDLKHDLVSMGAPTAFGEDADFSGIASLPYPGGNPYATGLKIARVIHQATIDIAEKSTEAVAATAVVMDVIITGLRRGPPPPPPFIFRADHPLLFVLVDNRTGMILFMGRYVAPKLIAE